MASGALKSDGWMLTRSLLSKNAEVAALLDHIADLLELKQESFKTVAYRRAAEQVRVADEDLEDLARDGRLHEVPGVGASIAAKIAEYLQKGELVYLKRLEREIPGGLAELVGLPGLGPKRVSTLNKKLGIKDAAGLKKAAQAGQVSQLDGFGKRTEQGILQALERQKTGMDRFLNTRGLEVAERFIKIIEGTGKVQRVEYAGSLRRGRDTVGDVDLLAAADEADADEVMEIFCSASGIDKVVAHGTKKSSIRLADQIQVDLRVVDPASFGAALLYFTGSKAHNVALRRRALGYGWSLNEYGLVRKKDEQVIAGKTEEDIYKKLKFEWVPPEIREDRGEIEAAKKGRLPRLVEMEDLVSDLHTHTTDSDGRNSAREMLEAARGRGLKLFGFSDHSYAMHLPKGDNRRLRAQRKKLDALEREYPEMKVLQGSEVNIRKDGDLDTPKKILKELDYVIGSVHGSFDLSRKEQTRRILRAVDEGIDILGHPTARRMPKRDPIVFDEEKVFEACKENGVMLEVDGQPQRLDLPGEMVHKAKQMGCRFTIDSDAHGVESLMFLEYGVQQARRGWLEKEDVVSTWTPAKIERTLGRAKRA